MRRRVSFMSQPATRTQSPVVATSDAILAFDINTGAMVWSRQMTTGDVWNSACVEGDAADCPEAHGFDFDFGSSPILVGLPGGKRALIAGQKSGVVYALDPDNRGAVLWQTRIGREGRRAESNGDRLLTGETSMPRYRMRPMRFPAAG